MPNDPELCQCGEPIHKGTCEPIPVSEHTRLSVNMNQETADALRSVMDHYGVSVTEAVRIAVSLADFFRKEMAEGNRIQLVNRRSGSTREFWMP